MALCDSPGQAHKVKYITITTVACEIGLILKGSITCQVYSIILLSTLLKHGCVSTRMELPH